MCMWIRVSKLLTVSSTSFVPKTLSQVSPPSSKYNASFRCFLQSRIRIFWRTGLSFDPAGKMTAVWYVFIDIENGAHFPNKSGRFVRTLSKYATPLVGKSTREFHPVNWQSSFTSSWLVTPPKTMFNPGCWSKALSTKWTRYCRKSEGLYVGWGGWYTPHTSYCWYVHSNLYCEKEN